MLPHRRRAQMHFGNSSPLTSDRMRTRHDAFESVFANGFPYSRKLSAHTSCVNALAFSSGDGRFLASGGDDFRVHIWDFHQEDVDSPSSSFLGPRGNIFTLAFSAANRYLYSGGTDMTILKFDASNLSEPLASVGSPQETIRDHNDSIRGITCHTIQDEIFLSASEDGRILLHDGRADARTSRAQGTIQLGAEVTGVQYHPLMEHIFASSDGRGRVCLRDARMAFGPPTQRTRQGVVQLYNTKLSRKSVDHLSNPESCSISFDREGSKLAVTMLHYLPTIYSLSDPHPLATCSGRNLPDGSPVSPGERTYSNSCTMKHGSFGGPGLDTDVYYSAGSDDFRGYVWKIPSISELTQGRKEISADDWATQEWPQTVGFTQGPLEPRYVPVELSTPLCRLTGHESIVNTTVIHPHFLHIVTSGIERHIVLHSPTPSSPCSQSLAPAPTSVRSLPGSNQGDQDIFFRALTGLANDDDGEDEDPEINTLRMFDHILRQEGESDVFAMRRWAPDSDDEGEDVEMDSDSDE